MPISLHDAVVASNIQILGALDGLLDKAEAFCAENGIAPAELIDARLAPKATQRRELGTFVLRDVRVFLNSIDHQLDLVRAAGVSASRDRQETDREIVLTIRIPKTKPPAAG